MEEKVRKKAELLAGGGVKVLEGTPMPFALPRSTAGPCAGGASVILSFDGLRTKKLLSNDGQFELFHDGSSYKLTKNGKPFLDHVSLEPVVLHSPGQAFINLNQKCILECAFCTSPRLPTEIADGLSPERVVSMLSNAMKKRMFNAFAVTSSIPDSVEETVARLANCIAAVRDAFPNMSIGVEAYIDDMTQIDTLRAAGADEIKINVEAASREIFERVCPGKNYDTILEALSYAVSVFGKGKVATNIITGFGERTEDLEKIIDKLTSMGVCPNLRPLDVNRTNAGPLGKLGIEKKPDVDTLMAIAQMQKRAMIRNDLNSRTFSTMCFECGCCDLIPFKDF